MRWFLSEVLFQFMPFEDEILIYTFGNIFLKHTLRYSPIFYFYFKVDYTQLALS